MQINNLQMVAKCDKVSILILPVSRYDIHPKLVNFMAPTDVSQWTDAAK